MPPTQITDRLKNKRRQINRERRTKRETKRNRERQTRHDVKKKETMS
jgi:hypothetical protein